MNRLWKGVAAACLICGLLNNASQAQQPDQQNQEREATLAERAASMQAASAALQPAQREQAQEFFAMGFKLFQEGAFEAARLGFERGLAIDPGNGQARFYLGETLVRLKREAAAWEAYQLALTLAPNTPEGLKAEAALATKPLSAQAAGTVFSDCQGCPEMVVIPPGTFTMGSPPSELLRSESEGPQHQVRISKSFAAGKYEVTFGEWDACVSEGGCTYRPQEGNTWGRGRQPVMNVSWQDAKTYIEWLSRKSGKNYRLLTEAEWEYAARAGTTSVFSTGANINPDQANFDNRSTYAGSAQGLFLNITREVGGYPPNAFGLHDMHGNVLEWVEDCWNGNYNGAPSDGTAWSTGNCTFRANRGGSWFNIPQYLRSATRSGYASLLRSPALGFRVARTD